MENKMTGYPHIDKPWMQYYDENDKNFDLPKMSITEYMKSKNTNLDNIAIDYYGNKVSYGLLNDKIDDASKVLSSLSVSKDDRIMYLMPNIPETAYLMYGGSQIGAVSDYVDPRPDSIDPKISSQKILDLFKEEKCKYIVALDQCYLGMIKPIENELKDLGVENIVIVSPNDSMNLKSTFNYMKENISANGLRNFKSKLEYMKMMQEKIKDARSDSPIEIIDYNNLLKDNIYTRFDNVGYIPDKMDVIVHTSGTTNPKPKPIPLTNDNMNAYVEQTFHCNMPLKQKYKALHILPYFAAFGTVDVAHSGLSHGTELIQIPEFSVNNLGKIILEYKPQIVLGTPTWFINLINDPSIQHEDLSYIKGIIYGGDLMNIKDENIINKFLESHNCGAKIEKGHGMSETCGGATYSAGKYNDPGTLGIPMPKTIYSIVDSKTKEFVKFNDDEDFIEGEIAISSPATTNGVLDGNVIVSHKNMDGLDFIFTGDNAKMDRNGVFTFLSRQKRGFTRFDGYKVKPNEIESVINTFDGVKECIISPYYSEEEHGNMIMSNIVLDEALNLSDQEKIDFIKQLLDKCFIKNPNVSSRQIPTKFKYLDELPITKNGKIDFNKLTDDGLNGNEIDVQIDETNISINSINVVGPKEKSKILSLKKM